MKKFYVIISLFVLMLLSACAVEQTNEPPATLQAAVAGTAHLTEADYADIDVLLEKRLGAGQLMLYRWQNGGADCLAATYLTAVNNEWQPRETATRPCEQNASFMAAYTGNSVVESPFGPSRHTTVYGVSEQGHAVRVVWADGQVSHLPLEDGAFLMARSGRWEVERIELLDHENGLMFTEEWQVGTQLNS